MSQSNTEQATESITTNQAKALPNPRVKSITGESGEQFLYQSHLTGVGKIIYKDGTILEGEFVNGYLHGQGKKIWPWGVVYEGEFVHGSMQGQGEMRLLSDSISEEG